MNNGKTRASLLIIVALYLSHLAYELYQARGDTDTTMSPFMRVLFIVLFALAAVGLLIYAVVVWRRSGKEDDEKPQHREDSLK